MEIVIPPGRISRILVAVALLLTLASIAVQFSKYVLGHDTLLGFVRLFDANAEGNVPTWYSSSTLLMCSLLLAAIAMTRKRARDRYALHWGALSVIFLFLSLDEAAKIHEEMAGRPLRSALRTSGVLYYAWVIPYGVMVLIFALAFLKFLVNLPARTRRLFLLAGSVYVGGALGIELLEGYQATHFGADNMAMALMASLEEFLEMLGVAIFIHALLSYLIPDARAIAIHTGGGGIRP